MSYVNKNNKRSFENRNANFSPPSRSPNIPVEKRNLYVRVETSPSKQSCEIGNNKKLKIGENTRNLQTPPKNNRGFKNNNNKRHSFNGKVETTKNLAQKRLDSFRKSLPSLLDLHILKSGELSTYVEKPKFTPVENANKSSTKKTTKAIPWRCQTQETALSISVSERLRKVREDLQASTTSCHEVETKSFASFSTPSTSSTCISPKKEDVSLNDIDEPEEMEWESITAEKVISNIDAIRKTISPEKVYSTEPSVSIKQEVEDGTEHEEKFSLPSSSQEDKQNLIIVIDTNVFLSNLKVVKDLLSFEFSNKVSVLLIVPWMVLQELDYFKTDNDALRRNSSTAIRFINQELSAKNPKLKGQSAVEACDSKFKCSGPDDRILDCGLQYKNDTNIVVILSNDINLKNKAMVNNIEAYNSEEVIHKLSAKFPTAPSMPPKPILTPEQQVHRRKFKYIHHILAKLFRKILQTEMENGYGDIWIKMIKYQLSWPVPSIIKCIIKHWVPVFGIVYPKHLLPCFEKLLRVFENCKYEGKHVKNLVHASLDVCLHLQNVSEDYYQRITPCLKELKEQLKD